MKAFHSLMLVAFLLCTRASAQNFKLAGFNAHLNLYPDEVSMRNLSLGATYEQKIKGNSGFETGLYYRSERSGGVVSYMVGGASRSTTFAVSRRYLAVPVLYKYYGRVFNLSAGPVLDFFVDWKQTQGRNEVPITNYRVSPRVQLGYLIKLSKFIPVSKQFLLEPEVRLGSVRTIEQTAVGIGIAGKYRL